MAHDLTFVVDDRPSAITIVLLWSARIVVAAAFLAIGASKFPNDPHGEWVRVFARIGLGQWFRYFTGLMQVTGALLLLTRRTISIGAFLIGCTMVGASIVDATVMRSPGVAIVPLALLGLVAAIWFTAIYGTAAQRR